MTDNELFQIRGRIWILYQRVPLDAGGTGWSEVAIYRFEEHIPRDIVSRHGDTMKLVCYIAK
jgi:hypothetical protein